ncbi:glutaredoxin-like protein NrdH [Agromyces sp. GXQ0307]|uniref:glutaredoxin-like protein NrdH n=1 Tax=Agromyces sp. GXQ0307 TaxID=3377835 RepID=UPI00383B7AB4
MAVTVYSKPSCVQCNATYRALDAHGIDYEVVDLSADPEALDELRRRGKLQAPVVVTGDDEWTGFRPDKIDELAARHAVVEAVA